MRPVLKFPGRRRDAFWFNGVEQALMPGDGQKKEPALQRVNVFLIV